MSATPRHIVEKAFGVRSFQVIVPDWATREKFNIRAVLPTGATTEDVPAMLHALLVSRFGLAIHTEPRRIDAYELRTSPSGHRMREVDPMDELGKDLTTESVAVDTLSGLPGDEFREIIYSTPGKYAAMTARTSYTWQLAPPGVTHLDATRVTMAEFISLLSSVVDRPIIDRTALSGFYQFKTILPPRRMSANMQGILGARLPSDPSGIDLSHSLEELGLRLEPTTSNMDFIVVDAIERPAPD